MSKVLPLDASVATCLVQPRPNITAGRSEFVYTKPVTGIPQGDSPLLLNTSYTITAEIEVPFAFTGKLNKLTLKLDRPQLSPADIKKLEGAMRNNKTSE